MWDKGKYRSADALIREFSAVPCFRIKNDRERRIRLEDFLDLGYGACELSVPAVAQRMEDILLYDDARRCRLLAWVIMPNHVHVLIEVETTSMSKLAELEKISRELCQLALQPNWPLVAGRLFRPLHPRRGAFPQSRSLY